MKNIIIILIVSMLVTPNVSCEGIRKKDTGEVYSIKIIDGCEYIECNSGIFDQKGNEKLYGLTHKGNCRFCIKRDDDRLKKYLNLNMSSKDINSNNK